MAVSCTPRLRHVGSPYGGGALAPLPCRSSRAVAVNAGPCTAAQKPTRQQGHEPHSHERRSMLLSGLAVVLGTSVTPLLAPAPAAAAESPAITTVFVAGATGSTGRRVVLQLRARGFKVRAGCRDIKKGQSLGFALDPDITLVTADVTHNTQELVDAIADAQAVICATGYSGFDPSGYGKIDETGTMNLVDAAKAAGVSRFVLLSSLLTNAPAVGQGDNPGYKFLNLFGGVLDHKHVAELYLRKSGLNYTIVRPGGLTDDPPSTTGALVVGTEDTLFGLPGEVGGVISRDTVAQVLVAALQQPAAANRVVEIEASPAAPGLPETKWFGV